MSHFIENTYNLQSEPILKTISKQVVIPPLKNFKHCQGVPCDQSEQKMLKVMFFQLKNEEFEKIHEENAYEMRKQFQLLKKKLAVKAQQLNVQKSMHITSSLPKLELSEIIKMNPQKIDLLKKYRSKIHGKLSVFRQAEEISRDKEEYNEWYDSVKNSPLKSPMFNKMVYLLEKVDKKDKENERFNLGHSISPKAKGNRNMIIR